MAPLRESADEKETARVEAFSDGIFAFATTLLVLGVAVPRLQDPTGPALAAALREDVLPFFVLSLSFATIYIMWTNHHALFRRVRHVDGRLLASNGLLLLLVTLCPFPTALLATYIEDPAGRLAAAAYAGYFVLVNVAFNLLVESIARAPHHERHGMDAEGLRRLRRDLRLGFVAYAAAVPLALWSAWAGVAVCVALWVAWATTPFRRTKRA